MMTTPNRLDNKMLEKYIYLNDLNSSEKIILDFLFRWQRPIRAGDLSLELNIKHTTLNSQLQNLEQKELIHWVRYRSIHLTKKGLRIAEHLVRHHRVLELLFSHMLNMTPKEAHKESMRLFPFCSCDLINKVTKVIPNASYCPCGYPIPDSPDCTENSNTMEGQK